MPNINRCNAVVSVLTVILVITIGSLVLVNIVNYPDDGKNKLQSKLLKRQSVYDDQYTLPFPYQDDFDQIYGERVTDSTTPENDDKQREDESQSDSGGELNPWDLWNDDNFEDTNNLMSDLVDDIDNLENTALDTNAGVTQNITNDKNNITVNANESIPKHDDDIFTNEYKENSADANSNFAENNAEYNELITEPKTEGIGSQYDSNNATTNDPAANIKTDINQYPTKSISSKQNNTYQQDSKTTSKKPFHTNATTTVANPAKNVTNVATTVSGHDREQTPANNDFKSDADWYIQEIKKMCSKPALVEDYCAMPDELGEKIGWNITLDDILKKLFSNSAVNALERECAYGQWCLTSTSNNQLILNSQNDVWTNPEEFRYLCWPGLPKCIRNMVEELVECPKFTEYNTLGQALEMMCDIVSNFPSPTCVSELVASIHVTMADQLRMLLRNQQGTSPEPAYNERQKAEDYCHAPDIQSVNNVYCLRQKCPSMQDSYFNHDLWWNEYLQLVGNFSLYCTPSDCSFPPVLPTSDQDNKTVKVTTSNSILGSETTTDSTGKIEQQETSSEKYATTPSSTLPSIDLSQQHVNKQNDNNASEDTKNDSTATVVAVVVCALIIALVVTVAVRRRRRRLRNRRVAPTGTGIEYTPIMHDQ